MKELTNIMNGQTPLDFCNEIKSLNADLLHHA